MSSKPLAGIGQGGDLQVGGGTAGPWAPLGLATGVNVARARPALENAGMWVGLGRVFEHRLAGRRGRRNHASDSAGASIGAVQLRLA